MMVRRLIGGIEHGVQPARIVFHPARDLLVALVEIARLRRLVRYQIGEGDAVGLTQRFFVIRRQRLVAFGVGLDDGIVTVIVAYACEGAAVAYFDAAVDVRRAGRERLDVGTDMAAAIAENGLERSEERRVGEEGVGK